MILTYIISSSLPCNTGAPIMEEATKRRNYHKKGLLTKKTH